MKKSSSEGEVVLFFTGGTISMRPKSDGRGVVPCGDVSQLLADLAPYVEGVGLRSVLWSDLPSPHLTPEHMFQLAKSVERVLAEPAVRGAVVIHGTDVLMESVFMADLVVDSDKPVIYTGSMRFYGESGYDGIRNLINSIRACMLPLGSMEGVSILMADRFFNARDVVKINSLNVNAFEAPGSGPFATVAGDEILITYPSRNDKKCPRPLILTDSIDSNVSLVTCYAGMNDGLLQHLRHTKISGLVVEGFGAGNVPPGLVPGIEALIKDAIPVVLATRCLEGGVYPVYGYSGGGMDLLKKGVILANRLVGPKAHIQLMTALGAGYGLDQIRRSFTLGF